MRLSLLLFFVFTFCSAQNGVQSSFHNIPKSAKVNIQDIDKDFFPSISQLEVPPPDGDGFKAFLQAQKQKQKERFNKNEQPLINQQKQMQSADPMLVYDGFTANPQSSGSPNDNDMAIANNGWLVSVINSSIYMIDTDDEDAEATNISLSAFIQPLGTYSFTYDPKVEYDPVWDRFVMVFLNGTTSNNTDILVAFSEGNNPTLGWNLYEIPGNPFNAPDLWSDYPMIAFTSQEMFITINQIIEGVSWQEGFSETLIWQIDKSSGYFEQDLQTRLWSNIQFGGKPIRNLIPIQGGYGLKGPDIFFLSDRNFDVTNDTIFVLNLTGAYNDDETELIIKYGISDQAYGVPPEARQPGDRFLQTNDARILGGKFENGHIHFAGNSVNPNTGNATVFYGFIEDPYAENPAIDGTIIHSDSLDFGYPNLSFTGQLPDDEQYILTFNYTSPDHPTGMAGLFYNDEGFSELTIIREGLSYIGSTVGGGSYRWGDYSGSQRKYDEFGVVWASGSYGKLEPFNGGSSKTWVTKIGSPDTIYTFVNTPLIEQSINAKIGPNPSTNFIQVILDVPQKTVYNFSIYNANGQLVETLTNARIKAGSNRFSFSTEPLANGIYFLVVTDQLSNTKVLDKRFVVGR